MNINIFFSCFIFIQIWIVLCSCLLLTAKKIKTEQNFVSFFSLLPLWLFRLILFCLRNFDLSGRILHLFWQTEKKLFILFINQNGEHFSMLNVEKQQRNSAFFMAYTKSKKNISKNINNNTMNRILCQIY